MFLNSSRNKGPIIVILLIEDLMQSVLEVEERIGMSLNIEDILEEILVCIEDIETAQVELELCGLDLMNKHCTGYNDEACTAMINLFVKIGMQIFINLKKHGLYRDKKLRFYLNKRFLNNLIFVEITSDMVKMLNDQLNTYTNRPKGFVQLSEKPRLLSNFI